MPKAARKGDTGSQHQGFPPTKAISGSPNVEINGRAALRKGDALQPHAKPKHPPHPRSVAVGSGTVEINGRPAARVGDAIDCGGKMESGSGNVEIGG